MEQANAKAFWLNKLLMNKIVVLIHSFISFQLIDQSKLNVEELGVKLDLQLC